MNAVAHMMHMVTLEEMSACTPALVHNLGAPLPPCRVTELLLNWHEDLKRNGDTHQGESNRHQIVGAILCRLRPPFALTGIGPFPVPETLSVGSCTVSTGSPVRIHFFPPPGNWGQKVTRDGGPQFGECLILSEWLFAQKPVEAPNRQFPPQTPNFPKTR